MTLPDTLGFSMPREGTALPSATGPVATARPRHPRLTWQHKVLSAKERTPTLSSSSGGRRKEPSRGWRARSPGKERIPGQGAVSNNFGGVSLPGFWLSGPVWCYQLYGMRLCSGDGTLFRGWNIIIPPGIFFRIPGYFG